MKSRADFTKKDVLIVLGCAVFLLANLGAVGSTGRRRAKEAVCLSNLHELGIAYKMFLTDRDGRFQDSLASWVSTDDHLLWPYFQNEKLLLCPEAARPRQGLSIPPQSGVQGVPGGKFNASARWYDSWDITWEKVSPPGKWYLNSYGQNDYCTQNTSNVRGPCATGEYAYLPTPEDGGPRCWGYVNALAIKNASYVPLVLDAAGGGTPTEVDQPPQYDGQLYYAMPMNINEIRNFCLNRYNGAVNSVFLDFSARKVGLKQLWLLQWCRGWGCPTVIPLPTSWNNPNHWMYGFKNY
ncbi:MAG TPA: hypothetical protein VMW16_06145 [Sedimentisphaerales bacterium]|nr:hypothetical protein [Sedimentisphaerales bacterium]